MERSTRKDEALGHSSIVYVCVCVCQGWVQRCTLLVPLAGTCHYLSTTRETP